jgi:glutamate--cysteine ligase
MARDVSDATLITSRHDLVAWFEEGSKPNGPFRVGTEHEKFPFYTADHTPVPYEGLIGHGPAAAERGGIRSLLEGMQSSLGWDPIMDGEHIIGLFDAKEGGAISLEPGGQFELSGAPVDSIHDNDAELKTHFAALHAISKPLGIEFLTLGMSPKWQRPEIPMMPKQRYRIMAKYMPSVGTRGLDMMFRTSTVQANLDYASEADMVKKLRVSLALQPLTTALFANSPFMDGKPNGYLSGRSEVWRDTDNQRAGMLAFAFEDGMGFERYVDYALDVPMYFVKRGGVYHDVAGMNFRDLLAGKLQALPGEQAMLSDWANHLSTIFPEVRLKRYLEMRGADTGPLAFINALPALFVGLLYDSLALDGAWELVKHWTPEARQVLRDEVPRLGLDAQIAGRTLRDLGRDILSLSRQALDRRAKFDAQGRSEAYFLDPLDHVIAGGTQAELLLATYEKEWAGNIDKVFDTCVY